jgi:hypothetical protein
LKRFVKFVESDHVIRWLFNVLIHFEVLKKFPDVPRFKDFRTMFDKMGSQIEAVTIGVPDHSHFAITMMALGLGKHVFVEKPTAMLVEMPTACGVARIHKKILKIFLSSRVPARSRPQSSRVACRALRGLRTELAHTLHLKALGVLTCRQMVLPC